MKKLFMLLIGISMILTSGLANATTYDVQFTNLIRGAASYDADNNNVVVAGNSFYDMISVDDILGVNPVGGNFAIYAVMDYSDPNGLLTGGINGNQMLDIEIRAENLQFDLVGTAAGVDLEDDFRLNDGSYLATFNQIAAQGYVELSDGVWMDAALGGALGTNEIALSIILEDYTLTGGLAGATGLLNAILLEHALGGPVAGHLVGSGIQATTVPEPATMLLFGLGLLGFARVSRKKHQE